MYDLEIISKRGKKIKLRDLNVYPQNILIESIEQKSTFSKVDSSNTRVFGGVVDEKRTITVPFFTFHTMLEAFPILRDDLFGIFGTEEFYIREIRHGQYVTGKQYLVYLSDVIAPKQDHKFSTGKLVFETTETPYAMSIKTTEFINNNGLVAHEDGYFSVGMGLQTTNDIEFKYSHTITKSESAMIYNAGNVEVHPFESYLKITIKNIKGSLENMRIRNFSNGSTISFNKAQKETDVWVFNGPVVKKNSLNGASETKLDFIYLEPGENIIQLFGATSCDISFDFNYLYR